MYIVLELQTSNDGTIGNIITKHDTLQEAESKYYAILSAAALSDVPVHSAVILDNTGMSYGQRAYRHEEEPNEG